jgi:hypothetical protein
VIEEINLTAIERFQRIARNGSQPGVHSGERVVHHLALALHKLGNDVALLE